jgi:tight adherence protein C
MDFAAGDLLQFALTAAALAMISTGLVGLGYVGLRAAQTGLKRRARLSGDMEGSGPEAAGSAAGLFAGVIGGVRKLGGRIETRDPSELSVLRNRLIQAGFTGREAVAFYLGGRLICLVIVTGATLMLVPFAMAGGGGFSALLLAMTLAGVGVLGPDQFLKSRRTAMEREYREGFPDLLDLMVASVEAGLSLDAAVNRITEELVGRYPHLSAHLYMMTLELRAGQSRRDAWARFADRLGIDEARSFATMLRQAEEMGTSLGETLAVFSDDMRTRRMLKAEEKALALPAKLTLPLVLFIFPCLLGVLILPAAVQIAHAMHK